MVTRPRSRSSGSASKRRRSPPRSSRKPHHMDAETTCVMLSRELEEARQQQAATNEILRGIASSPGELEPLFHAILGHATRLCEAHYGAMWLKEGDGFRNVAFHGVLAAEYIEMWRSATVGRAAPMGRLAESRKPLQIADLRKDQTYLDGHPLTLTAVHAAGIRTLALVPILKEDEFVGAISIYRKEIRPFSDTQIELVQNFASQAAIAIENTRLFNELRQRTSDLSGSLEALREFNETLEQRVEAETRERLHIWNVSQDLLVVADLEGKYLSVNPAWTAILGWSAVELLGKTSRWLLHPDDVEKTFVETSRLAAGQKTIRFESRLRDKHGSYHWFSWKTAPDRGRIYGLGREITELKDAENKLREAQRELPQAARHTTLAAMSAAIAHEIKQPLGAIVANANAGLRWLTRAPPSLDEARDTLKDIAVAGHRANEVVQSVRAMFSRTDQAGVSLDVNDLIRETIALLRGDLEAASVSVELELASEVPLISGHRGQLQQVVLNLVTNAAEAMRTVTERVLRVASKPFNANGLVVMVEDSGTGIQQKDIDRIFDAFFTTKANGMGMGLAICRMVVEAHGGTLSASPVAPHGTAFRITLPGAG